MYIIIMYYLYMYIYSAAVIVSIIDNTIKMQMHLSMCS